MDHPSRPLINGSKQIEHYEMFCDAFRDVVKFKSEYELYMFLCQTCIDFLDADKTAVYRYDPQHDLAWCPASIGLSLRYQTFVLDKFSGLPGFAAIQHDQYQLIPDLAEVPILSPYIDLIQQEAGEMVVFFPMSHSADSIGLLAAYYNAANYPIDQHLLKMMQTVVQVAGSTVQKLHLLQDTKLALRRERKLNELNTFLNNVTDLPTILLSVVRMSAELVEADAGLLGVLIDPEMMTFYPHMIPPHIPLRPAAKGRGVAWQIVESEAPIITNNYFTLERAQHKWEQLGITSFLGVPLQSGTDCLGVITVFRCAPNKTPFSERDLSLLTMIAHQAATVMQNVRLFSEATHRATSLASTLSRQEELDKLKNQFIHTASHELRSPLGIIFGHAELLESGLLGELTSEQMGSIVIIGRRVRMLNDLVNDLTALLAAETQEFRRDLINTNLLVQAIIADHTIKAQELNVELQVDVPESLPYLNGDQTHLQRVFDNLFSNAFKYTPAGGAITLQVSEVENNIRFEFSDTGAGIEAEQLPRIFERFYQVHDKGKPKKFGTGLGLSLVKEIVEAHRGQVWADSQLGAGTTFTIMLPSHPAPI